MNQICDKQRNLKFKVEATRAGEQGAGDWLKGKQRERKRRQIHQSNLSLRNIVHFEIMTTFYKVTLREFVFVYSLFVEDIDMY